MALNTDIATRALVIALKSPIRGKTTEEIVKKTGLLKQTVNNIYT
jgi:hypothetical protein